MVRQFCRQYGMDTNNFDAGPAILRQLIRDNRRYAKEVSAMMERLLSWDVEGHFGRMEKEA